MKKMTFPKGIDDHKEHDIIIVLLHDIHLNTANHFTNCGEFHP